MSDTERRPVTILDGGMGKELKRIGAPFRQPEWSALALLEAPELVTRAHRNFIEAGAEVIITNTYSVVPFHLGDDRFAQRGSELATLAARLAVEAASGSDRPVAVAGSLPPVFGSYRPDLFDADVAVERWRVLIEAQAPFVDLWVAETVSSVAEFARVEQVLTKLVLDRRLWAAFTLADRLVDGEAVLRSGESMAELAAAVVTADEASVAAGGVGVEAVLFNCSQPEVIGPALRFLAAEAGLGERCRLGAYANAFGPDDLDAEGYAANEVIIERRPDLTPDRYADLVSQWIDDGATIVGGCCDFYPDHISALADRFGHRRRGDQ